MNNDKNNQHIQTEALSVVRTLINSFNGYNYEAVKQGILAQFERVDYMTKPIDILNFKVSGEFRKVIK